MSRPRKAVTPNAGEVIAYFLDVPIELAKTVLEIAAIQVTRRLSERDDRLLTSGVPWPKKSRARRKGLPPEPEQAE